MPLEETGIEQEKRRSQDEWENVIAEYLLLKDEVTIKDLSSDCLKIDIGDLDYRSQTRMTVVLRKLDWERSGGKWIRSV
jgi:hypothetical protein